jgi:hypothetical protein
MFRSLGDLLCCSLVLLLLLNPFTASASSSSISHNKEEDDAAPTRVVINADGTDETIIVNDAKKEEHDHDFPAAKHDLSNHDERAFSNDKTTVAVIGKQAKSY